MATLVFQIYAGRRPGWIEICQGSVKDWAAQEGLHHRLFGQEAFDLVPPDLATKTGGRLPMLADLARLALARRLLERDGWECVIYVDSDFLIWRPNALGANALVTDRGAAFGLEHWVQRDGDGRLKLYRNVHNAFMVFEKGGSVLPFYEETARHLIARVTAGVPLQFIGPKLLSALQGPAGFALLAQAGALSPDVIGDLLGEGDGRALARMEQALPGPLGGANLCASLLNENHANRLVERLLEGDPGAA